MDPLLPSPEGLERWLTAQNVAIVVLVLWVVSMHRILFRAQKRNDNLSDQLCQHIERAWHARWKDAEDFGLRLDSFQRNTLDAFMSAAQRRQSPASSSPAPARTAPPPPPPPPKPKPIT